MISENQDEGRQGVSEYLGRNIAGSRKNGCRDAKMEELWHVGEAPRKPEMNSAVAAHIFNFLKFFLIKKKMQLKKKMYLLLSIYAPFSIVV